MGNEDYYRYALYLSKSKIETYTDVSLYLAFMPMLTESFSYSFMAFSQHQLLLRPSPFLHLELL